MRWDSYEQVIKSIYEVLGAETGVKIAGYGPKCKRKGKSGTIHQIDVLTEHGDGAHTYWTAIEAKYWNKKVHKGIIATCAYIREDCNFDKAVVITNKGFTPSAIKVAQDKNVHLVELTEYNLSVNNDTVVKFFMNMTFTEGKINSIQYFLDKNEREFVATMNLNNRHWHDFIIVKPGADTQLMRETVAPFLDRIMYDEDSHDIRQETILFEPGTTIRIPGVSKDLLINGINVTGYKVTYTRLDAHYFQNKVWLLMKLLFEKKDMVYTMDGRVEAVLPREPIILTVGQKIRFKLELRAISYRINPNPALNTKVSSRLQKKKRQK